MGGLKIGFVMSKKSDARERVTVRRRLERKYSSTVEQGCV